MTLATFRLHHVASRCLFRQSAETKKIPPCRLTANVTQTQITHTLTLLSNTLACSSPRLFFSTSTGNNFIGAKDPRRTELELIVEQTEENWPSRAINNLN